LSKCNQSEIVSDFSGCFCNYAINFPAFYIGWERKYFDTNPYCLEWQADCIASVLLMLPVMVKKAMKHIRTADTQAASKEQPKKSQIMRELSRIIVSAAEIVQP
jgi:hypothetical protein